MDELRKQAPVSDTEIKVTMPSATVVKPIDWADQDSVNPYLKNFATMVIQGLVQLRSCLDANGNYQFNCSDGVISQLRFSAVRYYDNANEGWFRRSKKSKEKYGDISPYKDINDAVEQLNNAGFWAYDRATSCSNPLDCHYIHGFYQRAQMDFLMKNVINTLPADMRLTAQVRLGFVAVSAPATISVTTGSNP